MKIRAFKRFIFNKYTDYIFFRFVSPRFNTIYKFFRHGAYDSERLAMYHRSALWLLTNNVKGNIYEFGCANGESFLNLFFQFSRILDQCPHFYLFDSFQGLPDIDKKTQHDKWKKGDFKFEFEFLKKRIGFFGVPSNLYTIIQGFYNETLTLETWHKQCSGPIALVHIDCDLFDSTWSVLQFLQPHLQQGTILLLDDYYCSKGRVNMGERGALEKWLLANNQWGVVPWQDYSVHGKAFIVNQNRRENPYQLTSITTK